jgi:mono/diheme cytochrome c family protein
LLEIFKFLTDERLVSMDSTWKPLRRQARRFVAHLTGLTLIVTLFSVAALGAQSAQDDPAQVEAGMTVFETNCAGCHGVDGTGSGTGRVLTGIADQEPDRLVHVASVTNGKGFMPAFGESLDAEEIDAAVSYVRLTFVAQADESELAVTGSTSSNLVFAGLVALTLGLGLAIASRQVALRS